MYLCTRSGGNLFNLACLRVKTKVRKLLIRKILFEDGAALTAHTEGDYTLEVVEDFIYLGSTIFSNLSLDNELKKWQSSSSTIKSLKDGLG